MVDGQNEIKIIEKNGWYHAPIRPPNHRSETDPYGAYGIETVGQATSNPRPTPCTLPRPTPRPLPSQIIEIIQSIKVASWTIN